MTYDAALHHVILFGGQDNNGYFNDTWQLNSTSHLHLRLLLLLHPLLHLRPLHQLLPRPE